MASSPPTSKSSSTPGMAKPTYISSSGQTLDSLPLSTRLNRTVDTIYNFLGLYIVSLLSLDPYSAAQNSRFNTRGPGRTSQGSNTNNTAGRAGAGSAGTRSTGWFGGGAGTGTGSGPRGGGGGDSGGPGRRMGTVDDVRGPECGSCG